MSGLGMGTAICLGPTIINEQLPPKVSGRYGSFLGLFISLGLLISALLGVFFHTKDIDERDTMVDISPWV